jgi:hypothetical protein
MGKVTNNNFTRGISGAVSHDMVFRRYKGKTTVYIKTERTTPLSEKEKAHRLRFKEATLYGKSIDANAALKADYQLQAELTDAPNAYSAAVADYLTAPEVTDLNHSKYKGIVGDKIVVKAVDDFRVESVSVEITKADGTIVETGLAVLTANNITWEYVAKTANAAFAGGKIKVTAMDLPGNIASLEQVI